VNAGVFLAEERRLSMLVALAVVLLILALAGGIAINPLLFLLALLALVVFLGGGRRGTVI
jgi:regulator of sirC expression with transglutaminase-like and TPR domain